MVRTLVFPPVPHVRKGPINLSRDWNRNIETVSMGKAWGGGSVHQDGMRDEVLC